MSTFVSGGGFSYELISVGGKWSWKVTANNIVNSGQYYYVTDINTPFGPIYGTNTPIPGDVVIAMSDAVSSFQQQLSPTLFLVSGNSKSITVSEGDYPSDQDPVVFMNVGALGSLLSVAASSSQPWMTSSPVTINGIGKNQQSSFSISVDPSSMESSNSPYSVVLNLQDASKPLVLVPVTYTVTVLPRPEISIDCSEVNFSYDTASNSVSSPVFVTIMNTGPLTSILSGYISKVQNRSPWLLMDATSFGPVGSGSITPLTMSMNVSGILKAPGLYSETVLISSNNATNSPAQITVKLTVT